MRLHCERNGAGIDSEKADQSGQIRICVYCKVLESSNLE